MLLLLSLFVALVFGVHMIDVGGVVVVMWVLSVMV